MTSKRNQRARRVPLLVLCLLLTAGGGKPSTLAQQTVTSATLSGRVEDVGSAAVVGVSVAVSNVETNQQQTALTDGEGRYRFPYLRVGTYQVTAEQKGFATLNVRLTLTVGQALDVPLMLAVAGVVEGVNVTDTNTPVVETARTQIAETVVSKEVDSLPLNGRNYLDLAALTPGVTRTNPVANQRFPETSAVPGTGLSITGQRFINNGFIVDGLSSALLQELPVSL
ncbi:MAG: carboxypeptidase-like regulatory domain-containing protein [Pyrinomonadaceae bacterium]